MQRKSCFQPKVARWSSCQTSFKILVKESILGKDWSTVTLEGNHLMSIFHGYLLKFTPFFQSSSFSKHFSVDIFISVYTLSFKSLFLNKTSYLHLLIEVFLERIIIDYMSIQLQNMMIIMMMNCFCGMADQKKVFGLISSKDHCQIFSPSPISNMLQDGFEPVQNLSSALVEWEYVVVITTTPWYQTTDAKPKLIHQSWSKTINRPPQSITMFLVYSPDFKQNFAISPQPIISKNCGWERFTVWFPANS